MQRTSLVFAIALGFIAATPVAGQEDAEVRGIIERTNDMLAQWYAAGEIDSVAAYFAEDAWQMPPNHEPLVGREAVRSFWSQAVGIGAWTFDLDAQDVVVSGPIAVERGSFSLAFEAGSGSRIPSFQDRGNYLVLWRREDDGVWRIVWDAPVSSVPMAQAE